MNPSFTKLLLLGIYLVMRMSQVATTNVALSPHAAVKIKNVFLTVL